MDRETYVKSRVYSLEKINFGIIKDIYDHIETVGITYWFGLVLLWELAGNYLLVEAGR